MPPTKEDKTGADWFSWTLHLMLGLLVGFALGFVIAFRMVRYHFLTVGSMHIALAGLTLIGGAMTSYLGNRAWYRRSMFDPEEPAQNWASRTASLIIGSAGCSLVVLAIYARSDQAFFWSSPHETIPAAKPILALGAVFLSFVIYYALSQGIALTGLKLVRRDEQPHLFWLFVVSAVLADVYEVMRLFS